MTDREERVVDRFHQIYYKKFETTWYDMQWLGHRLLKCPMDMWMYQELIYRLKPDLIVETGTYQGGSAYFYASLLDLMGHGEVVTVDVDVFPTRPEHPRITYLTGSSIADDIVERVRSHVRDKRTVLVILDSDHTEPHVRREIELFSPMVTPGSYLVVEDTCVNGHPVYETFGPGPMEAVQWFLSTTDEFTADRTMERHLISFNPNGWLKRNEHS